MKFLYIGALSFSVGAGISWCLHVADLPPWAVAIVAFFVGVSLGTWGAR